MSQLGQNASCILRLHLGQIGSRSASRGGAPRGLDLSGSLLAYIDSPLPLGHTAIRTEVVGTRSLLSDARSRDPLVLRALRLRRSNCVAKHAHHLSAIGAKAGGHGATRLCPPYDIY